MRRMLLIGSVVTLFAPWKAAAEAYQFIISGDPVAAATVGRSSKGSAGNDLVTGVSSRPSIGESLEVRYRTWLGSDGINLETSELKIGFRFILR